MDVGQCVWNLIVTSCDLEQLKDTDVGSEKIQVKMDYRSGNKRIGEILFSYMTAAAIISKGYLHRFCPTEMPGPSGQIAK